MTSGSPPPSKLAGAGQRLRAKPKIHVRQLAAGAVIALVIVFAVLNTGKVNVDWIVTTSNTRLIVVIVLSFLLGAVGGALMWHRHVKR